MCAFVPAAWPAARAERCCGDEAARHERENEGLASESTHVLIPLSASFWGVGFVVQVVFFFIIIIPWKMFSCPNLLGLQKH